MQGMGDNQFNLNLIEYGTLAEDTDPNADVVNVIIPKIAGTIDGPDKDKERTVDKSKFINSEDSTIQASDNTTTSGIIKARVVHSGAHRHDKIHDCWPLKKKCVNWEHEACTCHKGTSHLSECKHFHHDHHMPHVKDKGMVPKGTKVMVLFMDYDPNDAWLLRWLFEFPSGKFPDRPYDAR